MNESLDYYGQLRRRYLRENHRGIYTGMLLKDTLWPHLCETDTQAAQMEERLLRQMQAAGDITEELKANDQMKWVRRMNNIRQRAREVIIRDLINNL